MAKIIIDTNEFIDLLKLKTEEINTYIEQIKKDIDYFIFPQQIIDETLRHLALKRKGYKKDKDSENIFYDTDKCKRLEDKSFLEQIKKINKALAENRDNDISDFNKKTYIIQDLLFNLNETQIISRDEDIIAKASNRKICGNPPSSNSRIGDEIIWESILKWNKDDILIVSSDHTFEDNKDFLSFEYAKAGKKLLGVCKKLEDARSILKLKRNKELSKIEDKENNLSKTENTALESIIRDDLIRSYAISNILHSNITPSLYTTLYANDLLHKPNTDLINTLLIPNHKFLFDKNYTNIFDINNYNKDTTEKVEDNKE